MFTQSSDRMHKLKYILFLIPPLSFTRAPTTRVVFFANTLSEMIRWWLYKQVVITLFQLKLLEVYCRGESRVTAASGSIIYQPTE